MLEKIGQQGFESVSRSSSDAVAVLRMVMENTTDPAIAEVGVGIGATTVELLKQLRGRGNLYLFDFTENLDELVEDISIMDEAKGVKIIAKGNSRQTFDSYAWTLAEMLISTRSQGLPTELFDFVYLDGAHAFHIDAPACAVLKEMIKPNGFIVFDDMYWSFNKSPSMNPEKRPKTKRDYSDDQIEKPHVAMVVDLFMANDDRFEQVFLTDNKRPSRSVFRRKQAHHTWLLALADRMRALR